MEWLSKIDTGLHCTVTENCAEVRFDEARSAYYVELTHTLPFPTDGEEFVLFPACCYNGNRFDVLKLNYPPLVTKEQTCVDMPITITDVPRLEKDGSGMIEVTTGDVSVPCVAVFSKKEKRAVLLFTIQHINEINLGLAYEKGTIHVTYPHMRKHSQYRWPHMVKPTDCGIDFEKGTTLRIPYRIIDVPCEDLREFYHIFFTNRKCMGLDDTMPPKFSAKRLYRIQQDLLDTYWNESVGFWGTSSPTHWMNGWVSGGMMSYAAMKLGGAQEFERGLRTIDFTFRTQVDGGLFHEQNNVNEDGQLQSYSFASAPLAGYNSCMPRRAGDVLYYLVKQICLAEERGAEIPAHWIKGIEKAADALIRVWKKYGQLGQSVDLDTDEIVIGGSTSAGIVAGALVKTGAYLNNEAYVAAAKEIGEWFCQKVLQEGCTTGGPGEALQCPDSESAYGILEGVAALYEHTREERWLTYGKFLVEYFSSWVVAYNYCFPADAEFRKLGMKTVGAVFANAQNKHAAPGICTHSGASLRKFYEWTGDEAYLQLYREVCGTVYQYVSREDRVIYSWKAPKDPTLLDEKDFVYVEPQPLSPGSICERINMSDWETPICIGGVFPHSCIWCEGTSMLMLAECADCFEE